MIVRCRTTLACQAMVYHNKFKCLFSSLEPSLVPINGKHGQGKHLDRRLSPSDELLMVLMRLRTGTHLKDLAFRCGFKSVSHVSVLFQRRIFIVVQRFR